MSGDVPLLPGEVLGYRVWRARDGELASYVAVHPDAHTAWAPGVATASCRHGHQAPYPGCRCGLHAHYEPPDPCCDGAFGRNEAVYGAVVAWGAIDTTSTDFRAQHARIVCLAFWRMQTWHHTEQIRALARRHGVRCVELGELPDVAREYASEIPRALRGLPAVGYWWPTGRLAGPSTRRCEPWGGGRRRPPPHITCAQQAPPIGASTLS